MRITQATLIAIIGLFFLNGCASLKRNQLWQKGELLNSNTVQTIPFEERNGMIFLKVAVEGKTFDFLLDTGAPNVLDKQTLAATRGKGYRFGNVGDAYGRQERLEFTINKDFAVGPLKYKDVGALIADFQSVPLFACMGIDGLLGSNLMRKSVWQFDFQKNEITVAPNIQHFNVSKADTLSFWTAGTGTPKANVKVGSETLKGVSVDFGSGNGITLLKSELPASALQDTAIVSVGTAGVGLYGTQKDTVNYIITDSLQIGTASLQRAIIRSRPKTGGLLGLRFWKNYLVTIDWPNLRLYFEAPGDTKMKSSSFGFSIEQEEGKYLISSLSIPSAAYEAGFELGDRIIRCQGKEVDKMSYCDFIKLLEDSEELDLEVEREGQKITKKIQKRNLFVY